MPLGIIVKHRYKYIKIDIYLYDISQADARHIQHTPREYIFKCSKAAAKMLRDMEKLGGNSQAVQWLKENEGAILKAVYDLPILTYPKQAQNDISTPVGLIMQVLSEEQRKTITSDSIKSSVIQTISNMTKDNFTFVDQGRHVVHVLPAQIEGVQKQVIKPRSY